MYLSGERWSSSTKNMASNVDIAASERSTAVVWNLEHQKLVDKHSK